MQLREYQKEAIDKISSMQSGAYLIQMATGLGKCFAPGTKILMFDGSVKNVEDIQNGEMVMGADSTARTVVNTAHGYETMYRIIPVKGSPYTVNESHILSLKITGIGRKRVTDCNGKTYTSGEICNISVGDYLKCSTCFKHVAKGWRTGVAFVDRPLYIPPYILGLWLGDGSSAKTEITTMEPEVLAALKEYCAKASMKIEPCLSQNAGKATTYSITGLTKEHGCNELRNELTKYGLLGDKHIPTSYLINGENTRLELLAGLLDTDGYMIDNSVFEYSTVKAELCNGVLFLARSLGFAAYCKEKIVDGTVYYRINISGETERIPTRVPRRQASKRRQKKSVLVTGIGVERVGNGEYFGFELSGKDRLFLLADFTVVHNTVTFANLPRTGRTLLLSHRDELVRQPEKYYNCSYGIEKGSECSHGEEVVSASVQSLTRRLERFDPAAFDTIICDEAHHAAANTYRRIFDYFSPRLLLGFTATPNRGDKVRLDDVFSDIIFSRDLRFGIQNGYLCDILCKRVNIGFDLSAVRTRHGDYAPGELDEAMEGTADAIAEAYRDHAIGATLIFAVSVHQAEEIAKRIDGSVVVTGETKNRSAIIEAFTAGEVPCLVNVMVFSEGTDIPRVETVIIARPTQSESLYAQMVGRGLRLYPGKEKLTLIDCVGVSGKASLCTAPSLLGIDMDNVPARKAEELEGMLFELPDKAMTASDCPESWIKNVTIVNLWAQEQKYQTHDVNWFKMPDGSMVCSLPEKKHIVIPCPDSLGMVTLTDGSKVTMQTAFDRAYIALNQHFMDSRAIWDLQVAKRWGQGAATENQMKIITRRCKNFNSDKLTKFEASQILNRLFAGGGRK